MYCCTLQYVAGQGESVWELRHHSVSCIYTPIHSVYLITSIVVFLGVRGLFCRSFCIFISLFNQSKPPRRTSQRVAGCCSVSQCVAVCCSVLQCAIVFFIQLLEGLRLPRVSLHDPVNGRARVRGKTSGEIYKPAWIAQNSEGLNLKDELWGGFG